MEGLEDSGLVLVPESNLGFESQHVIRSISMARVQGWTVMREGPGGSPGWHTTNSSKERMCLTMRSALELGKIWLHQDFFSITLNATQAKARIRDELARFSVIVQPGNTPFAPTKRTFTGKVQGQQDDMAVALQIALEASVVFFSKDTYRVCLSTQYSNSHVRPPPPSPCPPVCAL